MYIILGKYMCLFPRRVFNFARSFTSFACGSGSATTKLFAALEPLSPLWALRSKMSQGCCSILKGK